MTDLEPERLGPLTDLLAQVRDLKRVRDASSSRTLAERRFGRAWARIVAGEPVEDVALSETAAALVSVRMAGMDLDVMLDHGLEAEDAHGVLERAFDDVAGPVEGELRRRLRATLGALPHPDEPAFVDTLVRQPRAGATAPGLPRIVLEPAESHGDHSFAVAVFGVLLSPELEANPADVFLTGLAHHLFNVSLPDVGHAGDTLVGDALSSIMAAVATDRALEDVPRTFQPAVLEAIDRTRREHFDEPAARAFHAADVLDRVLEMEWHQRSAQFALEDALGRGDGQLDICHTGFYQSFQESVLQAAGVWSFESDTESGLNTESPSGSYELGGHGAVPAASPLAGGPGAEDGRVLEDGSTVARLERRELGS